MRKEKKKDRAEDREKKVRNEWVGVKEHMR